VTATGERYQLTSGKKASTGPQWSPDSRRLAFTSDRDGKRQIYLISPAGGEAAQLTAEETGVGAIAWSPDRRRHRLHLHRPRVQSQEGPQRKVRRV